MSTIGEPISNPSPASTPMQGDKSVDDRFWDFKASHYVTAALTLALLFVAVVQAGIYNRQAT